VGCEASTAQSWRRFPLRGISAFYVAVRFPHGAPRRESQRGGSYPFPPALASFVRAGGVVLCPRLDTPRLPNSCAGTLDFTDVTLDIATIATNLSARPNLDCDVTLAKEVNSEGPMAILLIKCPHTRQSYRNWN
jgi:hypothetical protein